MKKIIATLFIIVFALMTTTLSFADDAKEIVQKMLDRNDGKTEISRMKLSTAKYVQKGKKIVNAEKPRVKVLDNIRKDYGENEKDHKSVSIIIEPASEKGISFLQYDYEEKGKDTDQWIYLSAMGKIKRIVSGNDNEPKTGSFFGSEISYEDMEQVNIEEYTYKITGNETYRKKACWVIESTPTKERAMKSNYSKMVDYIDKENFISLKTILYSRSGKQIKKIYTGKIERIDGILIPRQTVVYNLETRRRTSMTMLEVSINKEIDDGFLTKRTLTDGAFRERHLKRYQGDF
jgi:hypothetical protein